MSKSGVISIIVGLFIAWSCAGISPSKTTGAKNKEYTEDLTAYRAMPLISETEAADSTIISVEADSTSLAINERLNIVLDTAAAYARSTIKYIDGFTIQVYAGNDRALASDFKMDIIRNFPDEEPKMVFEQPNYKVRIGQYYTRLEAQQSFAEVKLVFPRAILIPTRIRIP